MRFKKGELVKITRSGSNDDGEPIWGKSGQIAEILHNVDSSIDGSVRIRLLVPIEGNHTRAGTTGIGVYIDRLEKL